MDKNGFHQHWLHTVRKLASTYDTAKDKFLNPHTKKSNPSGWWNLDKHLRIVCKRITRSLDNKMQAMNGHNSTKSLEEQIDQWLEWDQVSCFQRKEHIQMAQI